MISSDIPLNSECSWTSIKNSLLQARQFVYDTPVWVLASLIAGIACFILKSSFAAPLFFGALVVILTRLVVKLIDFCKSSFLNPLREIMWEWRPNTYVLLFLALAVFLIVIFSPIVGLVFSCLFAIYVGMIIEFDIIKHKQQFSLDLNKKNNALFGKQAITF